ncbi:MAG: DNA-3-methyladenine glycosylase [Granulosicoccus sp.]
MYQLTDSVIQDALDILSGRDRLLADIYHRHGKPPLWARAQNFATLVHIILEQKVSLSSANAVMGRVRKLCPGMQPAEFLLLADSDLRNAGVSGSKVAYCQSIAHSLVSRELSLPRLRKLDDEDVIARLTSVHGIGPWTAGVYLMMALRRPDAWASGDRALVVSYAECAGLDEIPSYAELDKVAASWSPHRATAARLLWHAYLKKRNRQL